MGWFSSAVHKVVHTVVHPDKAARKVIGTGTVGKAIRSVANTNTVAWVFPLQSLYSKPAVKAELRTPYPYIAAGGLATYFASPAISKVVDKLTNTVVDSAAPKPATIPAPVFSQGSNGSNGTDAVSGGMFSGDGVLAKFAGLQPWQQVGIVAASGLTAFILWKKLT